MPTMIGSVVRIKGNHDYSEFQFIIVGFELGPVTLCQLVYFNKELKNFQQFPWPLSLDSLETVL